MEELFLLPFRSRTGLSEEHERGVEHELVRYPYRCLKSTSVGGRKEGKSLFTISTGEAGAPVPSVRFDLSGHVLTQGQAGGKSSLSSLNDTLALNASFSWLGLFSTNKAPLLQAPLLSTPV